MKRRAAPRSMKETFVGEAIKPEGTSFSVSRMAMGTPGIPREFSWNGRSLPVIEILEEWKESGSCRHGSGERYVRKHWFRVRTTGDLELKIYFERQARSGGESRWHLYSTANAEPGAARLPGDAARSPAGPGVAERLS
jgi:hypothetical protein